MSVNGPVTRFYNRQSGLDGPVSGALQVIYIPIPSVTNSTYNCNVQMPPGMGFEITDVNISAGAVGATPAVIVGDTAAGTQVVASVTITTTLVTCTVKDGTIDAGGAIYVAVSCTASDTVTEGNITIVGHVSSPPTSVI
jgi:hypothetical protein